MVEYPENKHPVVIPVEGTLDLHCFDKKETESLIREYLEECRRRGIKKVRIIHGKGKGVLMARVHSVLKKIEFVKSYETANDQRSSWGATLVELAEEDGLS
ncbi:Smr/MutS family protein [candidate division WOR-3 bacterium]|nr:Smr/MutS family protein [candidate division WOR-3 bacterium]